MHPGVCPACGIAYAKWQRAHGSQQIEENQAPASTCNQEAGTEAPLLERLRLQLCDVPETVDTLAFAARALLLVLLAAWSAWFIVHGIDAVTIGNSFLHGVDLAFHEFGHLFFRPFGEFMTILGGSLFQILLPLALLAGFVFRQRDNFAAAVTLWWCGQNFVDLSPYIRDAEYRVLPLTGGGEENHDWGNLLERLDAIGSCHILARSSFMIGALLMLLALLWGGWLLWLQRARLH